MQRSPLADIGFLASASPALREMVSQLARREKLAPGEAVFEHGDQGDALFAVLSGQVEVSVISAAGQKLSLDMMGPGDMFGEIALFAPGPRTASVRAVTATEVWRLNNPDVLRALRDNPDLYVDMIELAGLRMRWMSRQYHEQVFMDVTTRLARKILHLSGPDLSELQMSHADLAAFLGVTRETVSKTLSAWKRDGLLKIGRGTLRVLDAEGLKKVADIEDI